MKSLVPPGHIERRIYLIRGRKVMLDADLAALYGVSTARLNQQVRRNIERFPSDFMFALTVAEHRNLMLQIATSNKGRGGRRKLPLVFTEQGVAMLSSVLNSQQSIQVNIAIMRAFVRIRQLFASNKDLARRLQELEKRHDQHDENFKAVFAAIRELMEPPIKPRPQIGFRLHGK
jgi:hypothetical protein